MFKQNANSENPISKVGVIDMKKCVGGKDGGKEMDWEETYTCGSGRHFGILRWRNASRKDYVKKQRRNVTAEVYKV